MVVLPSLGLEFHNAAGIPVHSGVYFQQYFHVTFFFSAGDAAAAEPAREGAGRISGCAESDRCFAFSSDIPHYIAFFEQITIILNITSFIVPE
jgi:hypothetical protein